MQIERILKTVTRKQSLGSSAQFVGKISERDIELMEEAIQQGCEQINPDDWK